MTITITEAVYSDGLWTVVVIVDSAAGTFVGPFAVSLPEDATEAAMTAAVQTIVGG